VQQADGRINLAGLHDWFCGEHGYAGSLTSVQRYRGRICPAPKVRAHRRIETPPGAQARVDWVEFPGVTLGREAVFFRRLHRHAVMEPKARGGLWSAPEGWTDWLRDFDRDGVLVRRTP